MEMSSLSDPLYVLKRQARQRARHNSIPLHQALDETAQQHGFGRWSLLVARRVASDPVLQLAQQLQPGQLLLLAARPLQGKTRIGFALMAQAMRSGHNAVFFSLDCTSAQVQTLMTVTDADTALWQSRFRWDCSDDICADYVQAQLRGATSGTVVVIDYLQLLDQQRHQPPLIQQVAALRRLAQERQLVIVLIAQIKRGFEERANGVPGWGDVRLPNPLDAQLFDRSCFVHQGRMHIQ